MDGTTRFLVFFLAGLTTTNVFLINLRLGQIAAELRRRRTGN